MLYYKYAIKVAAESAEQFFSNKVTAKSAANNFAARSWPENAEFDATSFFPLVFHCSIGFEVLGSSSR
jgi:hypothetical protein